MTHVGGIGIAMSYHFNSGEQMLVRVCELMPMQSVIEYMARKHDGIKAITEPGSDAPRSVCEPITAATVIQQLIDARIATPIHEERFDAAAD